MKLTRKIKFTLAGLSIVLLLSGFLASNGDLFFQITKNLEIFSKVYRLVLINYVDEIDPATFTSKGIDAMLETLDPYTVFLNSSNTEIDLLMTGNTAGVGISVVKRGKEIRVSEIIEGYSAHREGVRVGDVIVSIDSVKVSNLTELSTRARGNAGSKLILTVRRDDSDEELTFSLTREKIETQNVLAAEVISGNLGYIKLYRFNKNAGDDVRKAIQKLQEQSISGLILDLRGNPGGRLDEAASVAKKFLPNKALIVSTRGRSEESNKSITSDESPVYKGPMVVLIDSMSASASEIVAGALQDHDRATIVGKQSYGKGLVQTVLPVAYDTNIKITTARYFTPSGRCIQIRPINQLSEHPDTLKPREFKTDGGKIVLEANGISPDVQVREEPLPEMIVELIDENIIADFAAGWLTENQSPITPNFQITDALFSDFLTYLKKHKVSENMEISSYLDEISTSLAGEANYSRFTEKIKEAQKQLSEDLNDDVKSHRELVSALIRKEILTRKLTMGDMLNATWKQDPYLVKSAEVLKVQKP